MSIEPSIKMIRNGYETTVIKGTMLPTDIVWRINIIIQYFKNIIVVEKRKFPINGYLNRQLN